MKRLLLIFSCVLCALVTWADTTIYSMTNPTAPTTKLAASTGSDLTATYVNGTGYVYNGKTAEAALVDASGVNLGGSGNSYLKIGITNGEIQIGDIIDIGVTTTDAFYVSTTSTKGSTSYTFPYTVTKNSVLLNATELYLFKKNASKMAYLTITRPSAAVVTSPTVELMTISLTYAYGTPTATPLSVDVTKVNDNDVLEYQWYVNSSNSTDGGTAITGANSSSYTPDISAVGILYYYCVIVEKDGDGNQVGNPAITNTAAIEVIAHVESPVFTEFNGTVQLDCATTAALVLYSLDNGATWIEYTKPFTVLDNDVTVQAKATVGGGALASEIVSYDVVAVKKKAGSSSIVLYYDATNNFALDANGDDQANAALVGKDGTEYEGWTIQVTGTGKTISYGTAIDEKTTIKGSNGRQMSILMPPGVCANRITLYSYVNAEQTTDKVYWKEVAGVNYGTNSIAMASWSDAANPDVRVYPLDDLEDEMTFNNAGRQLCFYAVIDYTIVHGSVSLNSEGYATYSGAENVYISGAQAYTCVLNDDKTTIDAQPIASNVVPAYNGVLLYGKPNTTATLIYQSSAEALGTNGLKPTTTANGLQPLEVALALNGNEFNLYTGSEFVSNKAYFPWSDSSQAKGITINFLDMIDEGDADAIDAATVEEETKTGVKKAVVNGQLVIKSANGIFNMAGARIK